MYCATIDGSGCGCGGACDHGPGDGPTLGQYGYPDPVSGFPTFYQQPYFGFALPGQNVGAQQTFGLDVPDWIGDAWSSIRGELGDAAADLGADVLEWIKRRVGQEAWERMPDSSRREVVRQAAAEMTGGVLTSANLPWLLAGGTVLLFALARR